MADRCSKCKAPWIPNAEGGCSSCGNPIIDHLLNVAENVHLTTDTGIEIKIIPNTEFDLHVPYRGQNILQVTRFIDKRLIDYFYRNPNELKTMNRRLFEELVAELFHGFGYEVELTKQTRDGGKDIIAIKNDLVNQKYLIECKRPDPKNPVGIAAVRELHNVKTTEGATKGIIVTTSTFTKGAREHLDKHKWELDGKTYDDIRAWLESYHSMMKKK